MVAGNVERRPVGALGRMGIVAAAHAALILLVGRGLGIVPPLIETPQRLQATIVDDHPIDDERPPTIDPKLESTAVRVPVPDQTEFEPVVENTIVAQPVEPGSIDTGEGGAGSAAIPKIEGVRVDARHPLSQPRYPSSATRDGSEGNVDVELYVLPNGRVGDARIARSSGFESLDQSTIDEAKRNWRLVPATRDGVPFAQWYKLRVTFKLTKDR